MTKRPTEKQGGPKRSWIAGRIRFPSVLRKTLVLLSVAVANCVLAQNTPKAQGAYEWFGRAGITCGIGTSTSSIAMKPTAQCGGIFGGPFFNIEAGVMGPQAYRTNVSGYFNFDIVVPTEYLKEKHGERGTPVLFVGYTRMFETGKAVDFGVGYAHHVDAEHSVQYEVRDVVALTNPQQHNVVFRVSWLTGLPD